MRKVKKKKKNSKPAVNILKIIFFFIKGIYKICSNKIIFIILILTIISGIFYESGYYNLTINKSQSLINAFYKSVGLTLKDVYIEGEHYTKDADIVKSINVKVGDPLPSIDIQNIKNNLERLPWIKYAEVERLYPTTLSIRMLEKKPIALWQYKNKIKLIDSSGEVIEESNLKPFMNLILLVGEDAPSYTDNLLSVLDNQNIISEKIAAAIRVGQRRWDLKLKNGTIIKLPEENPKQALKNLLEMNKTKNVLDSDMKIIDLRVSNKMFTS